jgi:hypothetical protein
MSELAGQHAAAAAAAAPATRVSHFGAASRFS